VTRLLLIAFFLEIGFVLTVVPWSAYWERNYFAEWLPTLHELITNNFVRGAVSGLGLVNIGAGVLELFAIFSARRIEEPIISIGRSPADD
jgi:hypothetical protein